MSSSANKGIGRDIALAVTLLTVLPIKVKGPASGERSGVAGWFPLVGLAIGMLMFGVLAVSIRVFYDVSGALAAVVLIGIAALTRGMHWDALADVADAWFVAPERRHEVMSDSRIGAFGATAIALFAVAQASLLTEVGTSLATASVVVVAAVCGRLAATFSAWLGKPAKREGLGLSVMGAPTALGAVTALAALAACAWMAFASGLGLVAVLAVVSLGVVFALGVPHVIAEHFGGVSGDTMGASVMVVETAVMASSLLVVAVLRLAGVIA